MPFKFKYNYHPYIFFENKDNFYLRFHSVNKLIKELRDLMLIYQQNLFYAQKFQKQIYDKDIKSYSYISDKKVQLYSKYIKTK